MTVGNNGELYVAGADTNSNMQIMKSLNAQVPSSTIVWNTPVSVNLNGMLNAGGPINPAGLLGQANVDVDRSSGPSRNNVYVVAAVSPSSSSDPGDVMFSRSTDGGNTWIQLDDSGITNCGDLLGGCGTSQGSYNLELAAVPNGTATDLYAAQSISTNAR